ncbi:glycosyltransferase [Acuticoccus sp.]|uniref:glycosyltransferase n=1 Tax=Acuticoccus sp. TaxID=1904378 RepID=UPI003B52B8CA
MTISVIVPVHNGAAHLAQTLQTLVNQTRPADELIVVDDRSDDGSGDVAEAFGADVRVVRGAFGGASAARLAGLSHARGDRLMFLDADDLLGLDVLAALDATLDRHPTGIACCTWMRYARTGDGWIAQHASCAPLRSDDPLTGWLEGWYHPPCSILWSRETYEASGGWDAGTFLNNDGDLMMRALVAGGRLIHAPAGVAYYRRADGSSGSLSGHRSTAKGLASRQRVLDRLADLLRVEGRLAPYRSPLSHAYERIAVEARPVDRELAERAAASAALCRRAGQAGVRHGGPRARVAPLIRERRATLRRSVAETMPRTPPSDPLVSVVIPTYNRAHLLGGTLESVLAQTFRRFEVLIVDDGGDDDTEAIVAALDDQRLSYIRQPRNGGVARARNRGLDAARGDYVAFLDSDDLWRPGKLAAQVELMTGSPDRVGIIYTGVEEHGADGSVILSRPDRRGDVWVDMLQSNVIHGGASNALMRRAAADIVGGFDATLPAAEDYDYWLRVCRFFAVDFVPDAHVVYLNPAADIRERRSRNFAANRAARAMLFERYREDMMRAGVAHRFLLDTARRELTAPDGVPTSALKTLARAARHNPADPAIYKWALAGMLPWSVRAPLTDAIYHARA